jgi:hypothetical protein
MKQRRTTATKLVPLRDAAEWVRRLSRKMAKQNSSTAGQKQKEGAA